VAVGEPVRGGVALPLGEGSPVAEGDVPRDSDGVALPFTVLN
jgi:hypothetical protein